ncbi:hypothetical protein F3I76_03345 [Pseudomonas sp. MT4]|nr:hypothetical protein [Pseudomonas sp. MT4]
MAPSAAQPFGPGLFWRDAAFLVAYLERPNFTPRALLRAKTGFGAAANETSTDPNATAAIAGSVPRWPAFFQRIQAVTVAGRKDRKRHGSDSPFDATHPIVIELPGI